MIDDSHKFQNLGSMIVFSLKFKMLEFQNFVLAKLPKR